MEDKARNRREAELKEAQEEYESNLNLRDSYKDLMNDKSVKITSNVSDLIKKEVRLPTQEDREIGRDIWKDLHLKDQGVPQGTSFGPMLASIILGKIMCKHNSLIYMDDGLIFLEEPLEPDLSNSLKEIGCELAPEKSRLHNSSTLIQQGLKFLGTRWQKLPKRGFYTMTSETRQGVAKAIIPKTLEDKLEMLKELTWNGFISPSKSKLLKWYILRSKLSKYLDSELITIAQKYNLFGKMLSDAYNPEVDIEAMKMLIEEGMEKARNQIINSTGSIGNIIFKAKEVEWETTNGYRNVTPSIFNLSTLSTAVLLDMLKLDLSKPIGLAVKGNSLQSFNIKPRQRKGFKSILEEGVRLQKLEIKLNKQPSTKTKGIKSR
jgi:hypothetical protein